MGLYIEDGTGSGRYSGVTPQNRLQTTGVITSEANWQTQFGLGFAFSSNEAAGALLDSVENALLYISNNGDDDIAIAHISFYASQALDAGSGVLAGQTMFRIYRNPTGGTIVTAGTPGLMYNRDFGSAALPAVTVNTGGTGFTLTGGTLAAIFPVTGSVTSTVTEPGELMIRPGNTVGITVQAPLLTIAQNVVAQGVIFVRQVQLI